LENKAMTERDHSRIATIVVFWAFISVMLCGGCDSECARPGPKAVPIGGMWGGDGIRLDASVDGVELLYDCARGSIEGAIIPDEGGVFGVEGRFMPTLGPQPEGGYLAWHEGVVDGRLMRMTVKLMETSEVIGEFELTFGAEGDVLVCRKSW
jgi:hypothetical protein